MDTKKIIWAAIGLVFFLALFYAFFPKYEIDSGFRLNRITGEVEILTPGNVRVIMPGRFPF